MLVAGATPFCLSGGKQVATFNPWFSCGGKEFILIVLVALVLVGYHMALSVGYYRGTYAFGLETAPVNYYPLIASVLYAVGLLGLICSMTVFKGYRGGFWWFAVFCAGGFVFERHVNAEIEYLDSDHSVVGVLSGVFLAAIFFWCLLSPPRGTGL